MEGLSERPEKLINCRKVGGGEAGMRRRREVDWLRTCVNFRLCLPSCRLPHKIAAIKGRGDKVLDASYCTNPRWFWSGSGLRTQFYWNRADCTRIVNRIMQERVVRNVSFWVEKERGIWKTICLQVNRAAMKRFRQRIVKYAAWIWSALSKREQRGVNSTRNPVERAAPCRWMIWEAPRLNVRRGI